MNLTKSPASREFELSLFGPGFGECALLHVGNGNWIGVDSCIDSKSKRQVILSYFDALGIDPATALKAIVVSHWHDDHIRGMAQLVKSAPNAHIWCSSAFSKKEVLQVIDIYATNKTIVEKPGTSELRDTLVCLKQRKAPSLRFPKLTGENVPVFVDEGIRVTGLSPSSHQQLLSTAELGNLMPKENEAKKRAPTQHENHLSVVLHIEVEGLVALLGGDLEHRGARETLGWTAILNNDMKPKSIATLYKVPHHGSENAHVDRIWDEMLTDGPVALVAPYNRGVKPLPSKEDRNRILTRTDKAWSTADPLLPKKKRKLSKWIEDERRECVNRYRWVRTDTGQIRIRANLDDPTGEPSVELFDGALHLSELRDEKA